MKGLKHDADVSAPQPGQRILAERAEIVAVNPHPSGARSLDPPRTIITVDFPEPEGPTRLTVSPASISSETPRKMLTGPAALSRVKWTSSSTTSGPPK